MSQLLVMFRTDLYTLEWRKSWSHFEILAIVKTVFHLHLIWGVSLYKNNEALRSEVRNFLTKAL